MTPETLKAPARRIATEAIENVHLAYYEKKGIREMAEELRTQLESASKHVYAIARYAAKTHPNSLDDAGELFVTMCDYAETQYKTEHNVESLREALPTWATYKSNVLRGLRHGMNPLEHKTEKIYRTKTTEKLRLEAPKHQLPEPEDTRRVQDADELQALVSSTGVPDALQQLVAQVVYAAEVVNARKLAQAEEILREAWQKLGALTDKRKL